MIETAIALGASIGSFFMVIAALGIFRLPDFYQRIHAPTKAATLGLMLLLVAVSVNFRDEGVATKSLLALIFFGATAPVGAHILCRAAYRRGVRPIVEAKQDEYAEALVRHSSATEPSCKSPQTL